MLLIFSKVHLLLFWGENNVPNVEEWFSFTYLSFGNICEDYNVSKVLVTITWFSWWLLHGQVFLKLIFKDSCPCRLDSILSLWLIVTKACSSFCFKKFCLPQITRNTTPMYRTPEMIDLYSNFPISEKQDIWVRNFLLLYHSFLCHSETDYAVCILIFWLKWMKINVD